ncbi:MAG: RNA polymerase sigma factor [Oscillospiraceae bacterium]|nr:RNA polymerase sigma factor [Oscillospiraceae bacterium]
MEDNEIVGLYWARSESAIRATAEKYGRYCAAIALNILCKTEDAEEICNDTWLAAWNSIPPNRPKVLKAYLGKITRRLSLKRWRDMSREKRGGGTAALALEELGECVPSGSCAEDSFNRDMLVRALNVFLSSLRENERRVFICRYWYMDSIEKISGDFGYSRSKVKSMLYRTRARLAEHLNREGLL